MLKASKIIIISISVAYLSACSIDGTTSNFGPYNFSNSQMIYPDSYDSYNYQSQYQDGGYPPNYQQGSSGSVVVPDSYHVGATGNPQSSKDMDKNWVRKQNPNSYTIEVASNNKPSQVARVLYKAPKSARSAEVQTSGGNYIGVYGTYPTYEAAQAALSSLPEDVRQNARIKSWNNVQGSIDQ